MKNGRIVFDKYDKGGDYHWQECNRRSPFYNPPLAARYKVVAQRLDGADRVLDVGCGDGYLMHLLQAKVCSVTGLDLSEAGVLLAARNLRDYDNCLVLQARCDAIPFVNKSFDRIVMADVIEHLTRPRDFLRETLRLLSPRGQLVLTTPQWRGDDKLGPHHVKEYKPDEFEQLLHEFFGQVTLRFFWPATWYKMYSTKIGWRLIREFARYLYNPYVKEGTCPARFAQMIAVCSGPLLKEGRL